MLKEGEVTTTVPNGNVDADDGEEAEEAMVLASYVGLARLEYRLALMLVGIDFLARLGVNGGSSIVILISRLLLFLWGVFMRTCRNSYIGKPPSY